jgi:predicted RNA-binding protein with PUA-like domain
MNYWLLKSEPDSFGIDHLISKPKHTDSWEGVRNYQARNMLRDDMQKGDLGFFYHSSCKVPGIAGIVKIVKSGYPDASAFDRNSHYYDPASLLAKPRWYTVDVRYVRKLKHLISLEEIRQHSALSDMIILRQGNRLSITPLTAEEWQIILSLE